MEEPTELVAEAIGRAQVDLVDALAQLEKIQATDSKSVAFTAHAINNYLTITGGVVELIIARLADHPDPQLRVWLEGIQHATDLMTHAVGRLTNAAATSDAKLRFEKVNLPLYVQRTCHYYQRIADPKSIRVLVESSDDVPSVWTDRIAVGSVLDNLLSNAVKFSPPGKQVWVRVWGEPNGVWCEVRDEGPGLSPDDQARLYQRGVRLTPKPTAGEASAGFGLAVAKELIGKLAGELECKSVLGHGCCFRFRLPAYKEPSAGAA